ncbi:MAG TPA: helix-turn-helix transcriptional regulator [Candidatus Aphodovivens avistercoris]|nr:helix-turn-helix transcriptional regulator [Candidatus Aphodovivens avistercoris]
MSERIEIEFGGRVRELREKAGLSSREFALMVGRSKAYIIQLENGHRNVSLDTIERIAAGLGISISDLFDDIDTHVEVGVGSTRTTQR